QLAKNLPLPVARSCISVDRRITAELVLPPRLTNRESAQGIGAVNAQPAQIRAPLKGAPPGYAIFETSRQAEAPLQSQARRGAAGAQYFRSIFGTGKSRHACSDDRLARGSKATGLDHPQRCRHCDSRIRVPRRTQRKTPSPSH